MESSEDEYLSDSSYDSDEADIIDNIYEEDEEYWAEPIETDGYVLGLSTKYYHNNDYDYILLNKVSATTFFKYLYEDVLSFLRFYSIIRPSRVSVDIIKLQFIKDSNEQVTYQCVLKTHYIRLIQRKWKNIMKQRKELQKKRVRPQYLLERSIFGKWKSEEVSIVPSLYGMMNGIV